MYYNRRYQVEDVSNEEECQVTIVTYCRDFSAFLCIVVDHFPQPV